MKSSSIDKQAKDFRKGLKAESEIVSNRKTVKDTKSIFRRAADVLGSSSAEVGQLLLEYADELDPTICVRDVLRNTPLCYLWAYPKLETLKKICHTPQETGVWQIWLEKVEEDGTAIVAFKIGKTEWIISNFETGKRQPGVPRIVVPASDLYPDVFIMTFQQFVKERQYVHV